MFQLNEITKIFAILNSVKIYSNQRFFFPRFVFNSFPWASNMRFISNSYVLHKRCGIIRMHYRQWNWYAKTFISRQIAYVDRWWHIEWWIIIVSHVHCHNRDSWLKHINSTFRFAFWNILECGIELGAAVMPCHWRMCREGRGVWGMASRLRTWMAVSILASSSSSFCSHLRITLFNSKWQIDINSCDLTKYLFFGPKKDMIQHFFPKIHSTHSTQLDSLTVASYTGH